MKINCNHHIESFDPAAALDDGDYPLSPKSLGVVSGDYTFVYTYPLRTKATFNHTITPATDIITILMEAQADYKAIYSIEDAACGATPNIPGMLNRQRSEGPYGIWGHCLSDLYFEEVTIDPIDKVVTFCIGS